MLMDKVAPALLLDCTTNHMKHGGFKQHAHLCCSQISNVGLSGAAAFGITWAGVEAGVLHSCLLVPCVDSHPISVPDSSGCI